MANKLTNIFATSLSVREVTTKTYCILYRYIQSVVHIWHEIRGGAVWQNKRTKEGIGVKIVKSGIYREDTFYTRYTFTYMRKLKGFLKSFIVSVEKVFFFYFFFNPGFAIVSLTWNVTTIQILFFSYQCSLYKTVFIESL